jgi:uncharacterized delta-60 repeat protein
MRYFLLGFALLLALNALAQPAGSLDPTFGNGGKVVTSITSGEDKAYGVALQSDGKIVVAGSSTNSLTGKDYTVVRYNSDGTLDNTFGTNGVVITDLQLGSEDVAYSVAIQADQKIVVAGYCDNGIDKDASLVRYDEFGALDPSFGNNGIVLTDYDNAQQDENRVVKIHPLTGKIIVGGSSAESTSIGKPVLARYLDDGTIDSTFNITGIRLLWIAVNDVNRIFSVEDLFVSPNGKISCVGYRKQIAASIVIEYWAAKVLSDGNMDTGFSTDGVLQYSDGSGSSSAYGMVQNANQDIILCGTRQYLGNYSFRTLKVNANGTISNTSVFYTGYVSGTNIASKIIEDINGNYVFAGKSGNGANSSFAVARINSNDLSSDVSFNTTGFALATFGNPLNESYNLVIQPDNKIVAIGYTGNDFALARFLGDDTAELDGLQLITPPNASSNQNFVSVAFDWSTAFGVTSYEIDVDVSPTFDSNPQTFATATSAYNANSLTPDTQYYWRVRASDGTNWGSYSDVWSFATSTLNEFNLVSPDNNAVNQNFNSLVLDWSNNVGATSYECQIDITQDFSDSPQTFTTASSSYTLNLLPSVTYYWRVRASDGTNWGDYSTVWNFTTNALNNFNLVNPANNAINQNYNALVLDWSNNVGATTYECQIDTTQNFSTTPQSFTSAGSNYTVNLLPSKTYYWHVRASDGNTWGQWTGVWSFTTEADPNSSTYEISAGGLILFPNPASDLLNMESYSRLVGEPFALIDFTGKEVLSGQIQSERMVIRLEGLAAGIYLLQIGSDQNHTYRLMIQ